MRKLHFPHDADVAVLRLSDSADVAYRQLWERERGRPLTPDPRPIVRRNDGTVVEVVEEVWDDYAYRFGQVQVRVFARTGDMFLVWMDEVRSVEPDE